MFIAGIIDCIINCDMKIYSVYLVSLLTAFKSRHCVIYSGSFSAQNTLMMINLELDNLEISSCIRMHSQEERNAHIFLATTH